MREEHKPEHLAGRCDRLGETTDALARDLGRAHEKADELERKHSECLAALHRQVELTRSLTAQVERLRVLVEDIALRDHDDGK